MRDGQSKVRENRRLTYCSNSIRKTDSRTQLTVLRLEFFSGLRHKTERLIRKILSKLADLVANILRMQVDVPPGFTDTSLSGLETFL